MAVKSLILRLVLRFLRILPFRDKSASGKNTSERSGTSDPWLYRQLVAATNAMSQQQFERPAIELARGLLGCVLRHESVAGMIVETEAYLGLDDLAAHASKGKTERTKVLFGPAGHAYVYFIYGMHECLNVVAETEGSPGCVLIRALEPLSGLEIMRERRHWQGSSVGLANGPGKLTQALAINRNHYGLPLDTGVLTIRSWRDQPKFEIAATPRIGITQCADWPLRFVWANHPCLSRKNA
jgi:DNA-3-methyladenine glycosylase